jgi:hypothetical protein
MNRQRSSSRLSTSSSFDSLKKSPPRGRAEWRWYGRKVTRSSLRRQLLPTGVRPVSKTCAAQRSQRGPRGPNSVELDYHLEPTLPTGQKHHIDRIPLPQGPLVPASTDIPRATVVVRCGRGVSFDNALAGRDRGVLLRNRNPALQAACDLIAIHIPGMRRKSRSSSQQAQTRSGGHQRVLAPNPGHMHRGLSLLDADVVRVLACSEFDQRIDNHLVSLRHSETRAGMQVPCRNRRE